MARMSHRRELSHQGVHTISQLFVHVIDVKHLLQVACIACSQAVITLLDEQQVLACHNLYEYIIL